MPNKKDIGSAYEYINYFKQEIGGTGGKAISKKIWDLCGQSYTSIKAKQCPTTSYINAFYRATSSNNIYYPVIANMNSYSQNHLPLLYDVTMASTGIQEIPTYLRARTNTFNMTISYVNFYPNLYIDSPIINFNFGGITNGPKNYTYYISGSASVFEDPSYYTNNSIGLKIRTEEPLDSLQTLTVVEYNGGLSYDVSINFDTIDVSDIEYYDILATSDEEYEDFENGLLLADVEHTFELSLIGGLPGLGVVITNGNVENTGVPIPRQVDIYATYVNDINNSILLDHIYSENHNTSYTPGKYCQYLFKRSDISYVIGTAPEPPRFTGTKGKLSLQFYINQPVSISYAMQWMKTKSRRIPSITNQNSKHYGEMYIDVDIKGFNDYNEMYTNTFAFYKNPTAFSALTTHVIIKNNDELQYVFVYNEINTVVFRLTPPEAYGLAFYHFNTARIGIGNSLVHATEFEDFEPEYQEDEINSIVQEYRLSNFSIYHRIKPISFHTTQCFAFETLHDGLMYTYTNYPVYYSLYNNFYIKSTVSSASLYSYSYNSSQYWCSGINHNDYGNGQLCYIKIDYSRNTIIGHDFTETTEFTYIPIYYNVYQTDLINSSSYNMELLFDQPQNSIIIDSDYQYNIKNNFHIKRYYTVTDTIEPAGYGIKITYASVYDNDYNVLIDNITYFSPIDIKINLERCIQNNNGLNTCIFAPYSLTINFENTRYSPVSKNGPEYVFNIAFNQTSNSVIIS